ncbi:MAG: hypothetical protein K8U03_04290 [Planctomycetia bacterium]|nr:hypothetical protein [Planctomycetia bacterium]
MGKEAKSVGPGVPVLGPLFGILFGRRVGPLLAIMIVFGGGGYWAWSRLRESVVVEEHYRVSLESIAVSPQPEWIRADVKNEALRDASLEFPLSLLDEQLSERIAKAFAFHPWVAEVKQVRKTVPAGIFAELVYRKPVCMVELPDRLGLYAIDAGAYLLPTKDFLDAPRKAGTYPRLAGITNMNMGRVGVRWPDPVVQGGALIAAATENAWTKLSLARIVPAAENSAAATPQFELLTRAGTRVVWGSAPGAETGEEMPATRKVESMLRYRADHGSLEGTAGPQRLDLRGKSIIATASIRNPTDVKRR